MKNYIKFLFLFATIICLSSVHTNNIQASDKDLITQKITSMISANQEIKKTFYADYDKNGRSEAFVITGRKKASIEGENTLWFAYINDNEVQTMKMRDDVCTYSKILKLNSVSLFCAAEYGATDRPMSVYRVVDNQAKQIFQGNLVKHYKGDSFTSIHSTYDYTYDKQSNMLMGHTWKPYYFYYKDGKIKQYNAKYITEKKFKKKYKGAKKIIKKYKKKGIKSILYRENGLIHINYGKRTTSYHYITYKVQGKKLIKQDKGDGFYLKKMKRYKF